MNININTTVPMLCSVFHVGDKLARTALYMYNGK